MMAHRPNRPPVAYIVGIYALLSFAACTSLTSAGDDTSTTIHGYAVDTSQQPLSGVTVTLMGTNQNCLTDDVGGFALQLGTYATNANLVVMGQKSGYGRIIRAVNTGNRQNMVLILTPAITGTIDLDIPATPPPSTDPNATSSTNDPNGTNALVRRGLAGSCPPGAGPGTFGNDQQQVACVCGDGGLPDPSYGCVCPSPLFRLRQAGECYCRNPPCPSQAVITATQGGVTANIGVASGCLLDPAGNRVTGKVDYAITLWGPTSAVASAPVPLVAQQGSGMKPLQSFGMSDMQFSLNNKPLTLQNGSTIQMVIEASTQTQNLLAAGYPQPNLYTVDATSGTWTTSAPSGTVMVYDGTKFIADVLDVSQPWNVDGDIEAGNGGCVTGRVLNACNPSQVLSDAKVSVWFMSTEQVRDFSGQTSGTGSYCISTPLANMWPGMNATVQTVNYFVSTQNQPTQTNQCDPAPPACTQCNPAYESWPENSRFCTNCTLQTNTSHNAGDPAAYADSCPGGMPLATLQPCTFCPGDPATPSQCVAGSSQIEPSTACTQLADLVVPGPGCSCKPAGATCGPSDTCCPSGSGKPSGCGADGRCQSCTVMGMGSICSHTDVCCGKPGDPALVCGDNLCVPAVDPTDGGSP